MKGSNTLLPAGQSGRFCSLKNADTDEIKLILNGSLTAMIVKPVKGDSYLSIVVPMRLANES